MVRLETEEEKRLRAIFKPFEGDIHDDPPLVKDAPQEAIDAFYEWRELSIRIDKETQAFFLGIDVDQLR